MYRRTIIADEQLRRPTLCTRRPRSQGRLPACRRRAVVYRAPTKAPTVMDASRWFRRPVQRWTTVARVTPFSLQTVAEQRCSAAAPGWHPTARGRRSGCPALIRTLRSFWERTYCVQRPQRRNKLAPPALHVVAISRSRCCCAVRTPHTVSDIKSFSSASNTSEARFVCRRCQLC